MIPWDASAVPARLRRRSKVVARDIANEADKTNPRIALSCVQATMPGV